MILESYKLSLTDLKVTCSTTIYKNLSLLVRIQNRQYVIVPSTGYFDGASTLKNRHIDTVDFQFDIQRNKYLPKQVFNYQQKIQLELKLIYRTGKINQKIYPINFNQFSTLRKGVKSKTFKIFERLYSLQSTILAKSIGTDSPLLNPNSSNLERVRSQNRFQKVSSLIQNSSKRRFFGSQSPDSLIKYTINQNIKITRKQEPIKNNYSQHNIQEQRSKSILRQSFQLKDESSSFNQRNKQFIQRVTKPIQVSQYPTKAINNKFKNYFKDQGKLLALQQSQNMLKIQLQRQKQHSYRLQKQIANLKNKIDHLYHQKSLLLKQKQQDRLIFQTKDKQQKIRQRRDLQNLKRQYENIINQKDIEIHKLSLQLKQTYNVSIQNMNKANSCQSKAEEIAGFLNRKIEDLQQQLNHKNQQLYLKNKELNDLIRQDHLKRLQIQNLHTHNIQLQSKSKQYTDHLNQLKYNPTQQFYIKQSTQQITHEQISDNGYSHSQNNQYFAQNAQNKDIYQLVDKQTKIYHQMLTKLETNMKNLQKQLQNAQIEHKNMQIQLNHKHEIINNQAFTINELQRKIKYLETDLLSQRKINADLKHLLHQSNTTESILKDKIEKQKDKKRFLTRSYSYGYDEPVKETVRIKTTYRLIYEPQSSIIYVPPIKKYTVIKEKNISQKNQSINYESQKYGVNYNEYKGSDFDAQHFTTPKYTIHSPYSSYQDGYFGNPIIYKARQYNLDEKVKRGIEQVKKQVQNGISFKEFQNKSRRSLAGGSLQNNYRDQIGSVLNNQDEYIVENLEDSYINQNGDYVKKKVKSVYAKNL